MPEDSRARLIAYLCQAGLSTARANAVLDDYTHGLAEKQRTVDFDWYEEQADGAYMARDHLADLIDPLATP